MHDVADIHKTQANASVDRCSDAGIRELEFSVVDLALIRLDGPIKLADQGRPAYQAAVWE